MFFFSPIRERAKRSKNAVSYTKYYLNYLLTRNIQQTRGQKIILWLQLAENLIPSMEWPWTTESNPPPIQDMQKTLESPLDSKEIKTVHPKGNHPWIFIGRTNAEAEAPILWPPDAKSWLNRKDPDAGKDWRQEEKGMTEDEMVGCHHRLNGHEFEQAPGVSDGQGSLVCCSPWGCKESDTTEWLSWLKGRLEQEGRFDC